MAGRAGRAEEHLISLTDLIQLAAGSIMTFVGLAGAAIGVARGRVRDWAPFWFGLFSTLYGVRLLVRVGAFAGGAGLPEIPAQFIANGITYAILAPACLLAASLFNRRSAWLRRLWQLDLAYAAIAIGADLVRGRPGSMMWLNPPAVTVNFIVLLGVVASSLRRARWTPGVTAASAGLAAFVVLAAIETYTGGVSPLNPNVPFEPIGMLALVWGLGLLVAEQGLARERRLVAVSHELETARRIQRSILPAEAPGVPGVTVAARLLPMTEVAGDFYDFLVADEAVGVLVADVSGHGVPAAIVASMVKIALASEADYLRDPGLLLTRLNRALSGKFDIAHITAVYACVDVRERKLVYSSAGHPPPLVRRAAGQVEWLEARELVLCVKADVEYQSTEVKLTPGDCVVLYTDGITEAEAPGGEFFGDGRLATCVGRAGGAGPAGLVDSLLNQVRAWRGGENRELTDDITVVAVRFDGSTPTA